MSLELINMITALLISLLVGFICGISSYINEFELWKRIIIVILLSGIIPCSIHLLVLKLMHISCA